MQFVEKAGELMERGWNEYFVASMVGVLSFLLLAFFSAVKRKFSESSARPLSPRDRLYQTIVSCLANENAWVLDGSGVVYTPHFATSESTPHNQKPCQIYLSATSPYQVVIGLQHVEDVFTKKQLRRLCKAARRIQTNLQEKADNANLTRLLANF